MVNLDKLKGRIVEERISRSELAEAMGITVQALNKKLSGKTKITFEDADVMVKVLRIDDYQDKINIFLQESSQN